jgi:hypothetical protein
VNSIIEGFGLRAFRRPLSVEEVGTYSAAYTRARGLGLEHERAALHVVRAMLSSAEFLFRMEFDPPGTTTAHLVEPYEMASRLSYFLWSSMPDAGLFQAAQDGSLLDSTALDAHIDRLMADPKSQRFVTNFSGQWLGIDKIPSHVVVPEVYPTYTPELGVSMMQEAYAFFAEFVYNELPWDSFLKADINFIDGNLGAHYGMTAPDPNAFTRVEDPTDARMGFLSLGAFLTLTSYEHRTSPTLRARWILENLACSPPPPPPPIDIPELEEEGGEADTANQNIRAILERHREDPACGSCHAVFDPFGIALEAFDGIGRHRTNYPNGDPIDTSGVFPDQTTFDGLPGMVDVVTQREGYTRCVSEKMFMYGLGRGIADADTPYLEAMRTNWSTAPVQSLRTLIKQVALADTFRFRHGEGN